MRVNIDVTDYGMSGEGYKVSVSYSDDHGKGIDLPATIVTSKKEAKKLARYALKVWL